MTPEIIFLLFIVVLFFSLLFVYVEQKKLPYKKVSLFTNAEKNFLRVLDESVGDKYRVMGKPRIADVILPVRGLAYNNWKRHFFQISNKHFDFIILSKDTFSPVLAIELNDKSHNKRKRKKRDALVERVCSSSGLPLLWINAKRSYSMEELKNKINSAIK